MRKLIDPLTSLGSKGTLHSVFKKMVLYGGLIGSSWLLGGLLRMYVGALPWGIDRAPRFLGFVLLGEIVRSSCMFLRANCFLGANEEYSGIALWLSNKVRCRIILCWIVYLVAVWFFPDLSWAHVTWSGYAVELLMAVVGCVLSGMTAFGIKGVWLSNLGVCSLGIMLCHKFPLLCLQLMPCENALSGWLPLLSLSVGGSICVTAIAWGVTLVMRRFVPSLLGENGIITK